MGLTDQSSALFRNSVAVWASWDSSGRRLCSPDACSWGDPELERAGLPWLLDSNSLRPPDRLLGWPLRFHKEKQSICETEKPEASWGVCQILFWLLLHVCRRYFSRALVLATTCQGLGLT